MNPIIVTTNSPLSRAFHALNYYMSVADHVGEGIAFEEGAQHVLLMTPYRKTNETDNSDYLALHARLEEIKPLLAIEIRSDLGLRKGITLAGVKVHKGELDNFARLLIEAPGPLGWGSMRAFLEERNALEIKGLTL